MSRLGGLPSFSRIARTIEHNRALRRRLIAAIQADASLAGLTGARLAALLQQLTGARECSDLTLKQLQRVAGELRQPESPRPAREGEAVAGGLGAPAAAPSPPSTPKKEAT